MVDLRGNPFYLDEEGIQWVEETIEKMSLKEKCVSFLWIL